MTTYLVTRHPGTRAWAREMQEQGKLPFEIDRMVEHLEIEQLHKGDLVIGTLPVHVAAALHHRKVPFWSLDIDLPPANRGKELSAEELARFGARLTRYEVHDKETQEVFANRLQARAEAGPQPSISFFLVSEQMAPAAIGWLHTPTKQVCLLASQEMESRAELLEKWFLARTNAPKVRRFGFDGQNYQAMLAQFERWADALIGEQRERIVVHLTGGTKPMAMALQRAFGKRLAAFDTRVSGPYVDTHQSLILEMLATDGSPTPMRSVLNIRDLLALHGIKAESAQSACVGFERWIGRNELFQHLLQPAAQTWLGTWYKLLQMADGLVNPRANKSGARESRKNGFHLKWIGSRSSPQFVAVVTDKKSAGNWRGLRNQLEGKFGEMLHGLDICQFELDRDQNGNDTLKLHFMREPLDELAFMMGGWMEAHLASLFAQSDADEYGQGVQFMQGNNRNELDIVAVTGNRTLLIEAKTANLLRDGKEDSKAAETVYKLNTVADQVGRYFNDRWLVSLRKLNPADAARAKKYNIQVFAPGDDDATGPLSALPRAIEDWVAAARLERDPGFCPSQFAPPTLQSSRSRQGERRNRNTSLGDKLQEQLRRDTQSER